MEVTSVCEIEYMRNVLRALMRWYIGFLMRWHKKRYSGAQFRWLELGNKFMQRFILNWA